MRRAFTLIELLTVIAIIGVLAAILFPVFAKVKSAAKNATCISNLNQIGAAINIYMSNYDDVFPSAVDASDKYAPEIWDDFPEFKERIPFMPTMPEALEPYCKSPDIFRCPSDRGTRVLDNHFPMAFRTSPSMFATYASSYFFRTEIAFRYFMQTMLELPANVNVMFDGAGHWHGSTRAAEPDDTFEVFALKRREFRYNTLFGDGHVKSLNADQIQQAWSTPL